MITPDSTAVVALVAGVTLLLVLGALAGIVLRGAAPALRHLIWALVLTGTVALTFLVPIAPTVPVPVSWLHRSEAAAPTREAERSASGDLGGFVTAALTGRDAANPGPGHSLPAPAQPRRVPLLALIWLVGTLVLAGRMGVGLAGLGRIRRRADPVTEPEWADLLARLTTQSGVSGRVTLLRSARVGAPLTWGLVRPVILLPADAPGWPVELRRDVLLHELAHVARRDVLVQLMAQLACALYWFHPGVWLAAHRLVQESERACDDRVLTAGTAAAEYASHLLQVARGSRHLRLTGAVAIGMARRSALEGRLLAVLDESRRRSGVSGVIRTAGAAMIGALLIPMAVLRPVPGASAPPAETTASGHGTAAQLSPLYSAAAMATDSTFTREVEAAPGETLSLDLRTGGDVRIQGWEQPKVRVTATLSSLDRSVQSVDLTRQDRGVLLHSSYADTTGSHSSSDVFEIRVPRRFNVHVRSIGGSLRLSDLEGVFDGHTGGGGIRLENVGGRVRLATGGGDVLVQSATLDGTVSTGGGIVKISNNRGNLTGTSGSGPVVYADHPNATVGGISTGVAVGGDDSVSGGGAADISGVSVSQSGSVTTTTASGGELSSTVGMLHITRSGGNVSLDEAPVGAIVSTGGGRVDIGPAGGDVRASTGGGDMDIGPVSGSVTAGTGAGDVSVTLAGGSATARVVNLTSGKGRIELTLPPDFDGRLELETAYTRNFGRETTIDAPPGWLPRLDHTRTWDDREGTPRRYVRASGIRGTGRDLVKIKTVNGDIVIRIGH